MRKEITGPELVALRVAVEGLGKAHGHPGVVPVLVRNLRVQGDDFKKSAVLRLIYRTVRDGEQHLADALVKLEHKQVDLAVGENRTLRYSAWMPDVVSIVTDCGPDQVRGCESIEYWPEGGIQGGYVLGVHPGNTSRHELP